LSYIYQLLSPIQHGLEHIVVFLYNNVAQNYGVVIIILTLLVRLILVPLTISQTKSMAKMQKLQPELKELQKKYKDDREKLQQETMDFYKKNNVNPLSGCLPLLLQMPVFFALFQVLRNPSEIVTDVLGSFNLNGVANGIGTGLLGFIPSSAELALTGVSNPKYNFLWMNLNEKDPYYILLIIMVVTMFISMKMTTTDPKQSKVMYIMPLAFGFISYAFPSGVLVYWVTSNIWSVIQQMVVNKIITKEKVKKELEHGGEEPEQELSEEEKKDIRRKLKKKKKRKR
jgi:YidC/Oxa1 family membrane protein insertase